MWGAMIRSSAGLIQSSSDGAGDDITMNEEFGVSVDEAASAGFGKAAVNSSGSDGARAGTSMTGGLQSGGQQSGKHISSLRQRRIIYEGLKKL